MTVKRYRAVASAAISLSDGGEYVKYEDYAALQAKVNDMQANVIPDGYALIKKEIHLGPDELELICSQCGNGDRIYGEFTDGLLWVGDLKRDDGSVSYGLHLSTTGYPEEGAVTIAMFEKIIRDGEQGGDHE